MALIDEMEAEMMGKDMKDKQILRLREGIDRRDEKAYRVREQHEGQVEKLTATKNDLLKALEFINGKLEHMVIPHALVCQEVAMSAIAKAKKDE